MRINAMIAVVKSELLRYPRDKRGSAQNLFRAAYSMARMNSLGHRAVVPRTAEAAYELALGCVRASSPDLVSFTPEILHS